jgi:hypothetical protein
MHCYLNLRLSAKHNGVGREIGKLNQPRRVLKNNGSHWRCSSRNALPNSTGRTFSHVKFCVAAILLLFLPLSSWGGARRHSAKQATLSDSGYVFALGTANRFLHAWQTGDLEAGMALLGDNARRKHNSESLEQFFSGGSDRAYEIDRGKGHPGRYRFPVVLVTKTGGGLRRSFSEIILVNTGKNDWAVDKLP